MAVIELDLYAPPGPGPRRPPPIHRYRFAGPVLIVVLLLALGGAAPAASVLWRGTGTATLSPPSGFLLIGGRLLTYDEEDARLQLTAWSMDPVRPLWSHVAPVPPAGDGRPFGFGWNATPAAGDGILLRADMHTTVLDARTGVVRWATATPVYPLGGGRIGLVFDERYRAGTEVNEDNTGEGLLWWGSEGVAHTEPPMHTDLRALDLRTGRQLWSNAYPGGVSVQDAPGRPDTLLTAAGGRLGLIAADTGVMLREGRLPGGLADEASIGLPVVGDAVVLERGTGADRSLVAYSSHTLAPIWQRAASRGEGNSYYCSDLICEVDGGTVTVLDPHSGVPVWRTTGPANTLIGRGGEVLELANNQNRPVRIRDAATGATRVDLRVWTWFARNDTGAPLLLGHPDNTRTVVGILPVGADTVQPLGYTDKPVTVCQSDDRHVACRTDRGVQVWAYRA